MDFGRRGQLTIFIIVGIVLVVGFMGYFFLSDSLRNSDNTLIKKGSIKDSLQYCFEIISKESLDYVGIQGGYYDEPYSDYILFNNFKIPFYFVEDNLTFPDLEFIELEIADSVGYSVESCIDLAKKEYPGFELSYDEFTIYVKIDDKSVFFENNLRLTVFSKTEVYVIDFSEMPIYVDSDFAGFYKIADYYVASRSLNPEYFCLDCLYDIAEKYDISIQISDYDKDILMIILSSNNLQNYPSKFTFLDQLKINGLFFEDLPQDIFNVETDQSVVENQSELEIEIT